MTTIVVGVDGSEGSRLALRWAAPAICGAPLRRRRLSTSRALSTAPKCIRRPAQ